ncbi:PASTA domain-containing protein [Streptomyces lateritius]|uniref:PASTA domain-containing protein n=1 Tax=Streptomyces lateritius TaxID=67313 RepID=A0ABW6YJE8_9ACTN
MSDPLADDPRTATVASGESISLSDSHKKVLLQELGVGEAVRSVYHDGWGYAVLTGKGLLLFRNLLAPKVTRVTGPLRILRSAYGMFNSVEILVEGKPHKLHGSKLDPTGEFLEAAGRLLPPGSPLRPGGGKRTSTWIRRHPVSVVVMAAAALVAGLSGPGQPDAVARGGTDHAAVVPDFRGASLVTAAATARLGSWRVAAADASSAYRTVSASQADWRVCFQNPSPGERARPYNGTLTFYAVPEAEPCPSQLDGTRRVVMPDLVGERFDAASRTLAALGLDRVTPFHAHTGQRLDDRRQSLADWQVCRQQPEAGIEVPVTTQVDLWLIGPDASCTAPSPKPKPKPKPKSESAPGSQATSQPKPRTQPSRDSASDGGTSGGSGDGSWDDGSSGSSDGTSGGSGTGSGVDFGQFCSPIGATATTSDGRPAKCFMGKDGAARWGYRSG